MKKRIVASIEARMTSSRLPGKVLLPAIGKVSMLEFMLNRVKQSILIDDIIVATTVNRTDDPIVELCTNLGIKSFRGSEDDVLSRVLNAHKTLNSDIIVELTGDCPLIDPDVIDQIIKEYLNNEFDYVSNSHIRSYPDGFDVQVFSFDVLEEVDRKANEQYDRENVSSYIYRSGNYNLGKIVANKELFWPDLRVTLDDKGDYLLIKKIIEKLYKEKGYLFKAIDVINLIKDNIHLLELNNDARVSDAPFQKVAKKAIDE